MSSYNKRITYFGAVRSISSWAKVAKEMCLCLAQRGALVNIYERKGFLYDSKIDLGGLEKFIKDEFLGDVVLTFEHPKNYIYLPENKIKIGFLVYEFTTLPQIWVDNINKFLDLVFVPSLFVYEVFVSSGVKKEKIRILRYGFNPDFYYPGERKDKSLFNFLCIASPQKREGLDLLLKAFDEAFNEIEGVSLIIKLSYRRNNPKLFELRGFEGLIEDYSKKLKNKLNIIDKSLTEIEMGELYRSCDVYVSFSKAEAFGLPFLEAQACGKPCIALNYSGQKDFLNMENSYFVPHKIEISKNEEYEISKIKQFSALPLHDMACKVFREVFFSKENLKKGFLKEGSAYYHWENIVSDFILLL